MEHSTSTYNKHKIENATDNEHGHNPSCGDDITLEIVMDGNIIKDLAFTGHGCAISQASTSIMIDVLRGETIENAEKIVDIFVDMIDRKEITTEQRKLLKDAIAFKNIQNMPARVKCALLAWKKRNHLLEEL